MQHDLGFGNLPIQVISMTEKKLKKKDIILNTDELYI